MFGRLRRKLGRVTVSRRWTPCVAASLVLAVFASSVSSADKVNPPAGRIAGNAGVGRLDSGSCGSDSILGSDDRWSHDYLPMGFVASLRTGGYGSVGQMIVHDGELVIGGDFECVDGVPAHGLAAWNGARWRAIPPAPLQVHWLAVYRGNLIASGWMNPGAEDSAAVAEWDGAAWRTISGGLHGGKDALTVDELVVDGETLYARGNFHRVGTRVAPGVAKWDGTSWSPLGSDSTIFGQRSFVGHLAVYNSRLYAIEVRYDLQPGKTMLIRWNGSNWDSVAVGNPRWLENISVYKDRLITAGDFDSIGGCPAHSIAAFDGVRWSALGNGLTSPSFTDCRAAVPSGDLLYAHGEFTTAGTVAADGFAVWDGTSWSAVGPGHEPAFMSAFATFGGRLVVCGMRTQQLGESSQLFTWDGSRWALLRSRPVTLVSQPVAFLPEEDGMHVLAGFSTPDDSLSRCRLGRWEGSAWRLESPPLDKNVTSGLLWRGSVVAGGDFDTLGTRACGGLALWNGTSWEPLSEEVRGAADLLMTDGSRLFVAGRFTRADHSAMPTVLAWDGSHWAGFDGLAGNVTSLHLYNGALVATGSFRLVGNVNNNTVARWNGVRWEPMDLTLAFDGYLGPSVTSAAVWDDQLVVWGNMTVVGGVSTGGYALVAWDGFTWRILGTSWYPFARIIGCDQGRLVVCGEFQPVGQDLPSSGIREFDGTCWRGLGSGIDIALPQWSPYWFTMPPVLAAVSGSLYVGGNIRSAGGYVSAWIARWNEEGLPERNAEARMSLAPNPAASGSVVSWSQETPGPTRIRLFDVCGRLVRSLADEPMGAGSHSLRLGDVDRAPLAAGLYILRLDMPGSTMTQKLVVVK